MINNLISENHLQQNTAYNTVRQDHDHTSASSKSHRSSTTLHVRMADEMKRSASSSFPNRPTFLRHNSHQSKVYSGKAHVESDDEDDDDGEFDILGGLRQDRGHEDDDGTDYGDTVSVNSTQSYHISPIANLKERLEKAQVNLPILEVRNESILESDWSDGDVIFSNSVCFSDYFMDLLLEKAKLLKKGAKWITCKLPESSKPHFTLEKTLKCRMSFGVCDFYVLQRSEYLD